MHNGLDTFTWLDIDRDVIGVSPHTIVTGCQRIREDVKVYGEFLEISPLIGLGGDPTAVRNKFPDDESPVIRLAAVCRSGEEPTGKDKYF